MDERTPLRRGGKSIVVQGSNRGKGKETSLALMQDKMSLITRLQDIPEKVSAMIENKLNEAQPNAVLVVILSFELIDGKCQLSKDGAPSSEQIFFPQTAKLITTDQLAMDLRNHQPILIEVARVLYYLQKGRKDKRPLHVLINKQEMKRSNTSESLYSRIRQPYIQGYYYELIVNTLHIV